MYIISLSIFLLGYDKIDKKLKVSAADITGSQSKEM